MPYPLAGSHILRTTLSKVSMPPSFRAFVTDLAPCSFMANSSNPSNKWSRVIILCFSEPCSKTGMNIRIYDSDWKHAKHTVLNTIRTPLVFRDIAECSKTVVEKFFNNAVFSISLKILKCMLMNYVSVRTHPNEKSNLDNERTCLMTCQRSPFSLQGFVDTELSIAWVEIDFLFQETRTTQKSEGREMSKTIPLSIL